MCRQTQEASLTEHFKELMREQSRIHQQLTEAAVKEAQQVVMADTAKVHLQERQERLQLIDGLRDKVNALAVAFDQRWGWVQGQKREAGSKGGYRVLKDRQGCKTEMLQHSAMV